MIGMRCVNSTAMYVHINDTNNTRPSPNDDDLNLSFVVLRTLFVFLNSTLVISGNIFSLWVLRITRCLFVTESSRVCMYALVMTDLTLGITGVLTIPPAILGRWPYGNIVCIGTTLITFIACNLCVLILVCLSVDRLLSVMYPLRYPVYVTRNKAVILALTLLLVSTTSTSVVIMTGPPIDYEDATMMCVPQWENRKFLPNVVFQNIISFYTPTLVVIGAYCKMYLITRNLARKVGINELRNAPRANISIQVQNDRRAKVSSSLQADKHGTTPGTSASVAVENDSNKQMNEIELTRNRMESNSFEQNVRDFFLHEKRQIESSTRTYNAPTEGTAEQHLRRLRDNTVSDSRDTATSNSSAKAFRMFSLITLSFSLAWLPYGAASMYSCTTETSVPGWVHFVTNWLPMMNAWWDCVIYILLNKSFREKIQSLLKRNHNLR